MNKKLIISCLMIILFILLGLIYVNETYKADTEIQSINTHLQKGNDNYNKAVTSLNNRSYNDSITYCNESYKEYMLAKESANRALNKSIKINNPVQKEYFENTLLELDTKISSTVSMYEGISNANINPYLAASKFDESNKFMQNSTQYLQKRSQIENDYPDTFLFKKK